MLTQSKHMVKGEKELEKAIDRLAERVKNAKNIFQVNQLQKDYAVLSKKIDACVREKDGKAGGFLASLAQILGGQGGKAAEQPAPAAEKAKEKRDHIELVDISKDVLSPYVTLLDGFSKGTILLADEREPLYTKLQNRRAQKFSDLKTDESDTLSQSLYNFFINKSNEAGLVEQEREELKIIIGSLAGYIQSLSLSSESFGAKLDEYALKITAASGLDEIKKIQHSILVETLEIQKANNSVREQLRESTRQVEEAGEKIAKLEKELEMAREEKAVDSLTQVYNRGYFDERIREALEQFKRGQAPSCLVFLDINHFKQFNDTYGHQAGDQVLRKVAELIKESVRASDTVARYGGEEFAVIIYKAGLKDAMKMAEKIRKEVARHEFVVPDKIIHVTISLGITEFTAEDSPETLIGRVDKGLYEAKNQGRNRVAPVNA